MAEMCYVSAFLLSLGLHSFLHGFWGFPFHGQYGLPCQGSAGALTGIASIQAIGTDAGIIPFGVNHKTIAIGAAAAHKTHLLFLIGWVSVYHEKIKL